MNLDGDDDFFGLQPGLSAAGASNAAGGEDAQLKAGESRDARADSRRDQQAWENLRHRYYDAGYRDAIAEARQRALQEGFTEGFETGADDAQAFGYWLGVASAAYALARKHGDDGDAVALELQRCRRELTLAAEIATFDCGCAEDDQYDCERAPISVLDTPRRCLQACARLNLSLPTSEKMLARALALPASRLRPNEH